MDQQSNIAILLTLTIGLSAIVLGASRPAVAADPRERDQAIERNLGKASKESLDLLLSDAAKARPDWMVTATAKAGRWAFSVDYVKSKNLLLPVQKNDSSTGAPPVPPLTDLVLPMSESVELIVTSSDDIDSFEVPGLGIKAVAVPGRIAKVAIDTTKPGVYPATCAAPCGPQDKAMTFAIHVVDTVTFKYWLAAKRASDSAQTKL